MAVKKRIAKIEVIKEGSPPDVDSDFNTEIRDRAYEHVQEIYGERNVSKVVTFGKLAAKNAFKTMCTIYEVPFATANKVASLVPEPIEGVTCSLDDIYNPDSSRYGEAAEFREAVSGSEWTKIMAGARALEGKYKSTGVHACAVIISSEPLDTVIPMKTRQEDDLLVTQWAYPECEKLGLIKFDFLNLDTVDLIQHTVEYIGLNGKEQPNMLDIIHGNMDDKSAYEIFQRGDTTGVFQFGSNTVRDFCKLMRPRDFNDIAATTALLRPGPMSMQTHISYANRKNGKEKVEQIHPDFNGSALETILEKTYGLCVYQEQVMQIASQIGGMSLKEGDALRKAMGKKKKDLMATMKVKFVEGGTERGFSEEALDALWNNMAEFARYGFNLSHSVAYAITAYECAYLKAHYPVEFMAALIAQSVGKKDKILNYLKEARTMGIKMGAVNINLSDVKASPDYSGTSGFDILYGIGGVDAVSNDVAEILVRERKENGPYKSVQDVVHRCLPLGVSNKKVYENLALSGAFDDFGVSRLAVVENIHSMLSEGKTKANKGESLFDMMMEDDGGDANDGMEIDLRGLPEYPFVEKLQGEANVVGLYLTGHPLEKVGTGLGQASVMPISKVMQLIQNSQVNIVGSVTDIIQKTRNNGKSIRLTIDDGTGYIEANLQQDIIKGMAKKSAQERLFRLFTNGDTSVSPEIIASAANPQYIAMKEIEKNNIYLFNISFRPSWGDAPAGARVNSVRPLKLSHGGKLPIRVRLKSADNPKAISGNRAKLTKFAELISKKYPGDYPIYASVFTKDDTLRVVNEADYLNELVKIMENSSPLENPVISKKDDVDEQRTHYARGGKAKGASGKKEAARKLPPFENKITTLLNEQELADNVTYFDTGFRAAKTSEVEELLASKFGGERVDFGVFNDIMLEDER